ncbi:MAG: UDP-N-acetylglucosamine 1-carboxyvinyltransferase [Alphaproteobacteria bacterium]|nr:UDP-N-acetylglucosamine 1-carboxyvinyltransferase [Alphaproteobacteria bacterium]
MDKIRIRGGQQLNGTIRIGGAKNAALPLMAACLLTDEPLILSNVPHLADITTMANLLGQHGAHVSLEGHDTEGGHTGRVMSLTAKDITSTTAPYDLVRRMRASVLVLGPLVAREGVATVSLPGGCAIGTRPVDIHLSGLEALGAEIEVESGYIRASAPGGLRGARFAFPKVSVGATENLLLAASLADGVTTLENAAREPEITDLAECLIAMGAKIEGVGTDTLVIEGVESLHGARHEIMPDRIEAGTYAMAVAIAGGSVTLEGASLSHFDAAMAPLRRTGTSVEETSSGGLIVSRNGARLDAVDVETDPYPGFPTDLQAQFLAMMTVADGASVITETIFENRFMHVPELHRMGANITLQGRSALVRGVEKLEGAPVMASDLRASASLVIAGLAAGGVTEVRRIYHLDRGYERLEEKLQLVGADIERVEDTE